MTVAVVAVDLLDFQPKGPITEQGLRTNINIGIQYIGAWLAGTGCVPIFNLMEDAATAEISRAQIWHWIRSPLGKLDDGRKVSRELFRELVPQELERVREVRAKPAPDWHDATPDEMTVPSTLADERATNPFLRAADAEDLGRRRALKDNFRG